ncbi:MAG: hypothetical protein ABL878_20770 [Burkholderiales bacterium]
MRRKQPRARTTLSAPLGFFRRNINSEPQYRNRLDESKTTLFKSALRYLDKTMKQLPEPGQVPKDEIPSISCSIK